MDAPQPTRHIDPVLLFTICGLTLFGFIMIASASSVVAKEFDSSGFFFVRHQLLYGGTVGLLAFLLGILVPYHYWRRLAVPALVVALVLLVLVFIPPFRSSYREASRWVSLGPISFQPTEITKLAFIVYLAALLEKKGDAIGNFRKGVLPFLVIMAVISGLIILQPDIGTLFIITAIAATMIFAAGFKLRHLFLIGAAGIASFVLLFNTAQYRLARIIVYLHPEIDPQGIGYQINQALLAVGSGSWLGLGFGRSRQKFHYLPEPATDSIFAIIAEELGLIRTFLVLGAFVLLGYKGYSVARRAPDTFGRLLACGITSWIVLQAFINIGSIVAITPLTGVPLPFISYGGTALAANLFAAGVLLNISKYSS